MSGKPTATQLAALQAFAKRHGRTWKAQLSDVWFNGRYDWGIDDSASLQQVRNTLGPAWLVRFKLPKGGAQ